jgi:ribosomal protein S11
LYCNRKNSKNITITEVQKNSQTITSFGEINFINAEFTRCGGDVAEDIQKHLRETLEVIPQNKVPSADTLLRELTEFLLIII